LSEIHHEYTKNVVCPYCGYEDKDSSEISPNDECLGLIDCEDCGKSFYASRSITVDYSSWKPTYGMCQCCHAEDVIIEDMHSSVGSYTGLCGECGAHESERLHKEYIESMKEGHLFDKA